jgi:hypothetical protein
MKKTSLLVTTLGVLLVSALALGCSEVVVEEEKQSSSSRLEDSERGEDGYYDEEGAAPAVSSDRWKTGKGRVTWDDGIPPSCDNCTGLDCIAC